MTKKANTITIRSNTMPTHANNLTPISIAQISPKANIFAAQEEMGTRQKCTQGHADCQPQLIRVPGYGLKFVPLLSFKETLV